MTNTETRLGNQRTVYGQRLVELGEQDGRIVACDADLSTSTMGCLFEERFPDRHFEMGIGEQNMASFAAGLSLTGKIPFIHSFAAFVVGRAYEQIRVSIAIGGFNVKIIGSSYGLSDFGDGATHQSFEDISLMRTLPNMAVFAPADAAQTVAMLDEALRIDGPVYMRVNRNDIPELSGTELAVHDGFVTEHASGDDCVIFAHGVLVSRAIEAARRLEKEQGIGAGVVNVGRLKPVDDQLIRDLVGPRRAVVVAEEHSVMNGLGSIVEHALRNSDASIELVGIQDRFGQSAESYNALLEEYGLTTGDVVRAAETAISISRRRT